MAQANYTTDLTTLTQNETNTGMAEPTAAGWTFLNTVTSGETDYFIQNTACTSATIKVGVGGLLYNNGAGFTIPTDGAVLCWAYFWAPGCLAVESSGGARQMIGSSLADFYYVNHLGSDSWLYGGWQCLAMADPSAITTDTQVGTPTATRQYTGWAYNAPTAVPGKGNPYGIDVIRYGRGTLQITNGDATEYGTFAAAAEFNDKNSTAARTGFTLLDSGYHRLGLFQYQDGAYKWQGHFLMGTAGTAVDFRDSNRLIFVLNTKHVTANFNLFEVRNASSRVDWTGITIVALGTVSKGRFLATDDANITLATCTFTDMDTFVFKSLSTITGTTFRRCGQITTGGATFTGCTIDNSTASSAMLAASPANAALISNTSFTSDNTGYGIEIGGTAANMTLTNVTFTNYNPDTSAVHTGGSITGNEAVYINIASGSMSLTISGGSTPSVASAGCTVTVVTSAHTVKVAVTSVSGAVTGANVYLAATGGASGPFPSDATAAVTSITRSGTTATVTHTAHGMATNDQVNITGITDKTEDNGVHTITWISANSYSYTTTDSGSTSYTGTIKSTFVFLKGLATAGTGSNEISMSRSIPSNQPVTGWARKSTSAPYYKEGAISGTVLSSGDTTFSPVLISDD